jgi:hypothetical protein
MEKSGRTFRGSRMDGFALRKHISLERFGDENPSFRQSKHATPVTSASVDAFKAVE